MRRPFSEKWVLTQGFGENPAAYARFGMKGHNGLDYALPTGTDVLAPHAGKVVEVLNDPTGYGLYIKIENSKEGSVLAHLKDNLVSIGTNVTEGQLIAHSNNTGNSTGPHLHWGYYTFPRNRQNGYAGFIDQAPLLPPRTTSPEATSDLQKRVNELEGQVRIEREERNKNWTLAEKYRVELEAVKKELEAEKAKLKTNPKAEALLKAVKDAAN